jgi:hypothetical protein
MCALRTQVRALTTSWSFTWSSKEANGDFFKGSSSLAPFVGNFWGRTFFVHSFREFCVFSEESEPLAVPCKE